MFPGTHLYSLYSLYSRLPKMVRAPRFRLKPVRQLSVRNAGKVSFSEEQCFLVRPVQFGAVDAAGEIGDKHPTAFEVQSQPDGFHQMGENDLGLWTISALRVHGRAIHRVATRRISAVCPVKGPIGKIEIQIDWLRQVFKEHLDVFAICRCLTLGDFEICAKDTSSAAFIRPLLGPIKLATLRVHRNAHAPLRLVLAGTRVPPAGIDKRFDVGTIQVPAHDSHPLAIAPVELPVLLIELQLLGSENAARRNNVCEVAPVKIRTLDGAVIGNGVAHVRPVDMSGRDINHNSVRKSPPLTNYGFQIGTVRVCGEYTAAADIQKKEPPRSG